MVPKSGASLVLPVAVLGLQETRWKLLLSLQARQLAGLDDGTKRWGHGRGNGRTSRSFAGYFYMDRLDSHRRQTSRWLSGFYSSEG